jgi:hypothetical protein
MIQIKMFLNLNEANAWLREMAADITVKDIKFTQTSDGGYEQVMVIYGIDKIK